MGLSPAPTLCGICSITAAVEVLCLLHLILSIVIVTEVSSVKLATWGGLLISPSLQCAVGAWCLIGIPIIIHAGVGAIYRVESNMVPYMLYLAGTFVGLLVWVICLFSYGFSCTTTQAVGYSSEVASVVCSMSTAGSIIAYIAGVGGVAFAVYLVWSMKEFIRVRQETELIRYQEPWQVVQSMADEQAIMQANMMKEATTRARAPMQQSGFGGSLQSMSMQGGPYGQAGRY